jgi:vitamin B12 transporter
MHTRIKFFVSIAVIGSVSATVFAEPAPGDESPLEQTGGVLPEISVTASRVANAVSAGSIDTAVTELRYQPFVDLQGRNLPEAQADLVIRGGTFDTSGVTIGAATIIDPQTGHFTTEVPLAPRMLTEPEVLTGSRNILTTFNATSGSILRSYREIGNDVIASVRVGGGTHSTGIGSIYSAAHEIVGGPDGHLNADFEFARSESDGTRPNGDFDLNRYSGRLQWVGDGHQTDLAFGHQRKFFRWPFMYAVKELHDLVGSSGVESEDVKTTLVNLNHRSEYGDRSEFEFGTYFRRNNDDYEFDRAQPGLFNAFKHTTKVLGATGRGTHRFSKSEGIVYRGSFNADEVESTALTFGRFASRSAYDLSAAPSYTYALSGTQELEFQLGASYADTNRGSDRLSPVSRVAFRDTDLGGASVTVYADISQSSQVTGYTAIASNPNGGLFRGNPDLERTIATNYETGYEISAGRWKHTNAVFYRYDRGLVDWTYSTAQPNFAARSARNVDLGTFGTETLVQYSTEVLDLIGSYGFLNKSADYGVEDIDASFYALNFPNHRGTMAIVLRAGERVTFRLDNELRRQERNSLRNADGRTFYLASASIEVKPPIDGMVLRGVIDNVTKENFEEVPGVPGQGRLAALFAEYSW